MSHSERRIIMIRKHTRFIPSLSVADHLFNWNTVVKLGSDLALYAEFMSRSPNREIPAADLVGDMPKLFGPLGYEFKEAVSFWYASWEAYRTEQSVYLEPFAVGSDTARRGAHLFLKFFKKNQRQPFQTMRVVIGADQKVVSVSFEPGVAN
jgi:hypothetical protein